MIERYVDEIRISVERFTVGESQFGGFQNQVNEVRILGMMPGDIELVEQGKVL